LKGQKGQVNDRRKNKPRFTNGDNSFLNVLIKTSTSVKENKQSTPGSFNFKYDKSKDDLSSVEDVEDEEYDNFDLSDQEEVILEEEKKKAK